MKIIVTGAAGFIGFFLSQRLLTEGHNVTGIDNFYRGNYENIKELNKYSNFNFVKKDLVNDKINSLFKNVDVVYHLAAVNGTKHFYDNPLTVLDVNVKGTLNVLNGVQSNHVKKFVFASSSEVYHNADKIPTPETEKIWMEDTTNPRFTYAMSKVIGEMYTIWGSKARNFDYSILRIFNSYGPRMDTSEYGQVVPEFIKKTLTDKVFTLIGDGKQKRSFCYVDDTVEMIIRSSKIKNVIMNIGNDKEITMLGLAKKIHYLCNKKLTLKHLKPREGDVIRRVPDISLAKKLLKYSPSVTLDEGLNKTVEWYKKSL